MDSIIKEKSAKPGVTVNIPTLLTTACVCMQKQNKWTASHCSSAKGVEWCQWRQEIYLPKPKYREWQARGKET